MSIYKCTSRLLINMKIGINARTFSVSQPGGALKVGRKIHEKLVNDKKHSIVTFGPSNLDLNSKTDSYFYPGSSQIYGMAWERVVLPLRVKKHKIDVLFCPNANGFFHKSDIPTVVLIHDMNSFSGYSSGLYGSYERTVLPIVADKAHHLVTVSQFSKEEIVKYTGVSTSKVSVVYNGIDNKFLREGGGNPIELPEKYVLFVGALNPRKNIDGVIKSFRLFQQKKPEYKLVMIGPKNKAVFQNYNIDESKSIFLPGFVSSDELKYAYSHASAFLFPSYYEGFGLPPLEAMACGTPVVASNTSSLPEILSDAALLADPNDHNTLAEFLGLAVKDGEERSRLIEKGYSNAQRFTWDRCVDDLTRLLNSFDYSVN